MRVLRSLENLLEELDAKYHCVETVEIMLSLNGARASFGMAQVGATYKPNKKAKHAEPMVGSRSGYSAEGERAA